MSSPQFSSAVSAWQQRLTDVSTTTPSPDLTAAAPEPGPIARTPAFAPSSPTPPVGVDGRPRERARPAGQPCVIVSVTILLLALVAALVAHQVPGALGPRHRMMVAVAAGLLVIGCGLVVLAVAGLRSGLLIPAGVLLCVWLAALQTGLVSAHGTWSPVQSGTGSADSPFIFSGTRAGIGITPAQSGSTVYVQAKASDVTITVPDTMTATIDYSLRYSDLTVQGRRIAGFARDRVVLSASAAPTSTTAGGAVTIVLGATMSRVVILHD